MLQTFVSISEIEFFQQSLHHEYTLHQVLFGAEIMQAWEWNGSVIINIKWANHMFGHFFDKITEGLNEDELRAWNERNVFTESRPRTL